MRGDNLNSQAIVILPSEALGGIDGPLEITGVAIGTKHLFAFDGGTLCDVAETGQHTVQRISQVKDGLAGVVQRTQQPPSQAVVVQVTFVASSVEVGMPTGCATRYAFG